MNTQLFLVLFTRVAGSGLALLFVLVAPFVLSNSEIGHFFQSLSSLIFLSILTRLGSEIYFFEKRGKEEKTALLVVSIMGGVGALFLAILYVGIIHDRYMVIFPLFTLNWIFASFLKSKGYQLLAQIIEYYVLYIVLLIYILLVFIGLLNEGNMIDAFMFSVVVNFFLSIFFIFKKTKFKNESVSHITDEVSNILSVRTLQNIMIMYGNYFVMWGPILVFSYITSSMDAIGEFSLAYKYAASLMLLQYVFHSVYSHAISNKVCGVLALRKLDIKLKQILFFLVACLWIGMFTYGVNDVPKLLMYTIVLTSSLVLYIVQAFKMLYLTYNDKKYILVYAKMILFMILGVLSVIYSVAGLNKIEYYLGIIFISFFIFFIVIEIMFNTVIRVNNSV